MALGLTDGPADQDHLGIESYYVGLADFIDNHFDAGVLAGLIA